MKKITFLIVAIALSVTATYAQTSTTSTTEVTQQAEQDNTIVSLKVSGITCGHDLKTLTDKVKALEGVSSCETIGKRGVKTNFKIAYNPSVVSEKDIRAAFESTPGCTDPTELPYKVK